MDHLRTAIATDLDFLRSFSGAPSDAILAAQIRDRRLRIIEESREPIGFLKFYVLWETLPFIEVIAILQTECGRGHGTRAVRAWEAEMANRGFDLVLISTQADESAQSFWRKLGYRDCGALCVRGKPAELFLQHAISTTNS